MHKIYVNRRRFLHENNVIRIFKILYIDVKLEVFLNL